MQRASSEAAHSQSQATGSLATMSNSTTTMSLPESESDTWDNGDGGDGGSPAGGLVTSSLESSDGLVRGPGDGAEAAGADADAASPEPAVDDSEESRFVRLVKQSVDGVRTLSIPPCPFVSCVSDL